MRQHTNWKHKFVSPLFSALIGATLLSCPSARQPVLLQEDLKNFEDSNTNSSPKKSYPVPCLTDEDCPSGRCDPVSHTCVDCLSHQDCDPDSLCIDHVCSWKSQCYGDADCPGDTLCNLETHSCVECLTNQDCPPENLCLQNECKTQCTSSGDCPDGLLCSLDTGTCVTCLSSSDCPESQWCDSSSGQCKPDACEAGDVKCIANNKIVCLEDGSGWGQPVPCPEGSVCVDSTCKPKMCEPNTVWCEDDENMGICNEYGTAIIIQPCPGNQTCQEGKCTGMLCQPQSTVCQGPTHFKKCNKDGSDWLDPEPCPEGWTCQNGKCVCQPQCAGKACGSDGCGGICGTCLDGYVCNSENQCVKQDLTKCGDQICDPEAGETPSNCPADCGGEETCGDGLCSSWESCSSCPTDCGECQTCGDGVCDENEDCHLCPTDCGECQFCGDMQCDKNENCATCPVDCGICSFCGDAQCDPDENCANCPADCGLCSYCGDGKCDESIEDCQSCPMDCGLCPCGNGKCEKDLGETCETCPQDCGLCLFCGDDVCAGTENCATCPEDCGPCPQDDCCTPHPYKGCSDQDIENCVCSFDIYCCTNQWDQQCVLEAKAECGLQCQQNCIPDCDEKECGPDGCGGTCGSCPPGNVCVSNTCVGTSTVCDIVPTTGCCLENSLVECIGNNVLVFTPCWTNPKCGWNSSQKKYSCGTQGGKDPSGQYPKNCEVNLELPWDQG